MNSSLAGLGLVFLPYGQSVEPSSSPSPRMDVHRRAFVFDPRVSAFGPCFKRFTDIGRPHAIDQSLEPLNNLSVNNIYTS